MAQSRCAEAGARWGRLTNGRELVAVVSASGWRHPLCLVWNSTSGLLRTFLMLLSWLFTSNLFRCPTKTQHQKNQHPFLDLCFREAPSLPTVPGAMSAVGSAAPIHSIAGGKQTRDGHHPPLLYRIIFRFNKQHDRPLSSSFSLSFSSSRS